MAAARNAIIAAAALVLAAGITSPGKGPAKKAGAAGVGMVLGSPGLRTDCLVTALAIPGDEVVSVNCRATVERWSRKTGELVSRFEVSGFTASTGHALSQDGSLLAAAQRSKKMSGSEFVVVWDAVTGKKLRTFDHHPASINGMAFSNDGKILATADSDEKVRLWDVGTGKVLRALEGRKPWGGGVLGIFDMPDPICEEVAARFSSDGTMVATAHAEGENRVHEVSSGKILVTMQGLSSGPAPVFLADGKTVAYASGKGIQLLSLATGKDTALLVDPAGVIMERTLSMAVSPDGARLAAGTTEGRVHVYDVDGSGTPALITSHADRVEALAFSADGRFLASGGRDRTIGLWDAATGKDALPVVRHFGWVKSLVVSPDARLLATAGEGASVHVWSLVSGKLVHSLRSEQRFRRVWMDHSLAFTPDGKLLYSGSTEGDLVAWDVDTGKEALRVDSPSIVSDLALSPDGKNLALVDAWGQVIIVDPVTAQVRRELSDQYSWGYHFVRWLADGKTIVSTGMGNRLMIWNAQGKVLVSETLDHNVYQLVVPPEKGTIFIRSYDTLHTWKRGKSGWKPSGKATKAPGDVAFSHDGSLVAMAVDEKAIHVRDRKSGKTLHVLKRKAGGIGHLAFTPDDARLVSTHSDGTVTVWTLPTP